MENFNKKIHKTSFERIVGTKSKKQKEGITRKLQEKLGSKEKELIPIEITPSERDKALIKSISLTTDKIVSFYGGKAIPIPLNKIYLVQPGSIYEATEGKFTGGIHSIMKQFVIVEKESSEIELSLILSHELLHLKSYKAAQINKDGELKPYRSGLQSFSRTENTVYFDGLEEAIVAETNKIIFEEEIRKNPLFKKEFETIDKIKEWLRNLIDKNDMHQEALEEILSNIIFIPESKKVLNLLINSDEDNDYKIGYLEGYLEKSRELGSKIFLERSKEREKLYELLENILEKSNGKFKNAKEVFDVFAKANFSGNLMPLARLIEKTLGKGSFRKIAEEF